MCPVLSVLCGSVPAVCVCSVCLSIWQCGAVCEHAPARLCSRCLHLLSSSVLSMITVLCFCGEEREEREEREEGEARCARFTVGFLGLLFVCCWSAHAHIYGQYNATTVWCRFVHLCAVYLLCVLSREQGSLLILFVCVGCLCVKATAKQDGESGSSSSQTKAAQTKAALCAKLTINHHSRIRPAHTNKREEPGGGVCGWAASLWCCGCVAICWGRQWRCVGWRKADRIRQLKRGTCEGLLVPKAFWASYVKEMIDFDKVALPLSYLIDWLIGWLVDWLTTVVDWSIDWLVDWSIFSSCSIILYFLQTSY